MWIINYDDDDDDDDDDTDKSNKIFHPYTS